MSFDSSDQMFQRWLRMVSISHSDMPICFNREWTSCLGTNCLGGELSSQSNSGRVVEDELSGDDLTKCRICKLPPKCGSISDRWILNQASNQPLNPFLLTFGASSLTDFQNWMDTRPTWMKACSKLEIYSRWLINGWWIFGRQPAS